MRQSAVAQQIVDRTGSPGLVVPAREDDAIDSRLQNCARAHRARFERDDQCVASEVPTPPVRGGRAQRQHLGVRRRVARELALIATLADDLAVLIDHNRADGNIAVNRRRCRERESALKCVGGSIRIGHDSRLPLNGYPRAMRVIVADHPLVTHKLTVLRDKNTPSPVFRELTRELVTLLAYDATREVRVTPVSIETPVTATEGVKIAAPSPLIVPILRAGLGMLDGITALVPTAEVGFLGMARDEETLQPVTYAERLPDDLTGRQCFVIDPMLATGGSLAAAIEFLFDRGADDVTAICLLGTPEGLKALEEQVGNRNVTIVLGALDERLNENGFIVPGLGDAGDRLYGTVGH